MKTRKFTLKYIYQLLSLSVILSFILSFNSVYAQSDSNNMAKNAIQERMISGIITNEDGPFPGVNVILKGSRIGTTSDENGEFTFPRALNTGDVLMFTYIGYDTQELSIRDNTDSIEMLMAMNSIEIMETLQSDKPYRSKRKKKN